MNKDLCRNIFAGPGFGPPFSKEPAAQAIEMSPVAQGLRAISEYGISSDHRRAIIH